MRPFGHRSGTLRGVAALVSGALTASILLLLRATSSPQAPPRVERQVAVAVITLPRSVPPPPTTVSEPIEPAATRAPTRRAAPQARTELPVPVTAPQPAAITPGLAAAPPAPPAPTDPASAPLRLDPRTIGRAIAASEGNIRQMARRSGNELDSPRASRSEALADTVAEKGVPDCLAPNEGGSLLSAPILLVLKVQGKCK